MKNIFYYLSIILFFASCEDVIEIELNDMEPQLVVEGVINDIDDQFKVRLSKTTDYFNEDNNPTVSDAVITLTDNAGNMATLNEIEPGIYVEESMHGKPNTSYILNILSEGKEYTANASIPEEVTIDSLTYEYNPESILYDQGYVVSCHFSEPGAFTNFYRLKTYNINDDTNGRDSEDIYDDDIFNGKNVELPWEYEVYLPLDTVVVELYTLDESTFDYYKTLFPISGDGMSISSPANPETNINNGALGFFGAYTLSRDTIVILPD